MDTANTRHLHRGTGVLVVEVSTDAAKNDRCWEDIEQRSGHGLLVRGSFGPGSVAASVPWTATHDESKNYRRSATVRLPYFNLADGVESTEAALVIEIVLSGQLGDEQTGNASNGPTGDGASWSAEDRQSSLGNSGQEKRMGYHPSRLVARGALDVQTALRSCSGAIEGVGAEGKVVCLSLGKAEVPGLGYDELSAKVTLCFSSEAAFAERVGGTQQHVGEDGVLPASFVVATTLFDCAAEIKEADLRLYARCGGSNKMDTTLLCSAKRGAIVVHDSFEWNVCADTSLLFPNGLSPCPRRRSDTLIVAICENNSGALPDDGRSSTSFDPHEIPGAIAFLEISCQDLVSCGPAGRWCPLRAHSVVRNERLGRRRDCQAGRHPGDVVGEALIAFAAFPWPVAAALPKSVPERKRRTKMERRARAMQQQAVAAQDSTERTRDGDTNGMGINAAVSDRKPPDLQHPLAEDSSSSSRSKASAQKLIVYLHVWDALVPLCRPESALYFSVRVRRPGSRGQRVSTKPTRGRGGPLAGNQVPAIVSYETMPSSRAYPRMSRGDEGAGSMHFVWDEHLSLSVDGGGSDGCGGVLEETLVELRLLDADINRHRSSTPSMAAREGEPLVTFGGRDGRSRGQENSSTKPRDSPIVPDPMVYKLSLRSHGIGGEIGISGGGSEMAKVRIAVLMLTSDQCAAACANQVRAFLQRKADVARIPGGLGSQPSSRTLDVGATNLASKIPALKSSSGLRLLDLSTARGLFNRFADDVDGVEDETLIVDERQRDMDIDDERQQQQQQQQQREASRKGQGATISREKLMIVACEYFPGLPQLGHELEAATSLRTNDFSVPTQGGDAASLSFADFISWLRKLPEGDLEAASLLVTPRTALDNTETVMGETTDRARELAATLKSAKAPARKLFGDWCAVSLRSTGEDEALDRVRLDWGEGGRGRTAESSWRRHTRLLREDVKVLDRSIAALELRSDATLEKGGREDIVVDCSDVEGRRVEKESAVGGVPLDPIVSGAMVANDACGDKTEVESAGSGVTAANVGPRTLENLGGGVDSIMALHLGQEAAALGVAAENLKEALRCASDAMRRKIENPLRRVNTSKNLRESASTSRVGDPESGRSTNGYHSSEPGGRRHCSLLADDNALTADVCPQCPQYGVLLRQIKQVRRLQIDIVALRRRAAAALPKRTGEKRSRSSVGWRLGGDGSNKPGDDDREGAPRSALALVKRIRLAREAARPPLVATPSWDEGGAITLRNRLQSHRLASSTGFQDDGESLTVEAATAACVATGRSETSSRLLISPQGSRSLAKGMAEGSVARSTCQPLRTTGAETPFLEMLQRPSSLVRVRTRLAGMQAAFDEGGIDLPPAIASTTAERVIEITCGGGGQRQECQGVSMMSPPSAALCCPIDRFALHVFRTADAAKDDGRATFCEAQELTGMDGLDTYASGKSLSVVAAKAGVVDVERWVAAAVLWQIVDALEVSAESLGSHEDTKMCDRSTTPGREVPTEVEGVLGGGSRMGNDEDARCFACDPSRSISSSKADGGVVVGAVRGSVEAVAAAEAVDEIMTTAAAAATSLSKDLRREELTLALGSNTAEEDKPSGGHLPESRGDTRQGTYAGRFLPSVVAPTNGGGLNTHNGSADLRSLHKHDSQMPGPCSFDHALVKTLTQPSRVVGAGCTAATAEAPVPSSTIEAAEQMCAEEALLYMYATAGFVERSGLGITDLVEAVKIRRDQTSARRGERCSHCNFTGDRSPNDPCMLTSLAVEDTSTTRHDYFDTCGVEQAATAATVEGMAEKSTGTERTLIGLPIELRELFRTAVLAEDIRRKGAPQQGTKEGIPAEISTELAAAAAEAEVIRVLDSNLTLESAAFSGGRTALHHAAARCDAFLVRLLLERGCKPHLKDFAGKRACDLTRNLECLRLLGALKKAPAPSALCLPTVVAPCEGEEPIAQATRVRAMTSVNFAVSFCLGRNSAENVAGGVYGSSKRAGSCREKVEEEQRGCGTGVAWRDGVAHWFDMRNKVLYIDHNREEESAERNNRTAVPPPPVAAVVGREGEDGVDSDMEPDIRRCCHPRSILDVRLTCCLSPRGGELFEQLQAFSCEWKDRLARDALDVAIDAAAELGALFRFVVLDNVTREIVTEVAREVHNDEQRIAADAAAALAVKYAAAQQAERDTASMNARELGSVAVMEGEDALRESTEGTNDEHPSQRRLRVSIAGAVPGESAALLRQFSGKNTCSMLNFRCTVIMTAEETVGGHDAAESRMNKAGRNSKGTPQRQEPSVHRYLARLTVADGVCTVVVRGRSYLRAFASGKGAGNKPMAINLEGGDSGIRRVLDDHAVSLSACLQIFDVMQDMEDPGIVFGMLAAGICQLSARLIEEGIEFLSLNQSEQEALKDDVLGELYHATRDPDDTLPEWEELTVTMRAYCGVTSVSLVGTHSGGEEKLGDGTGERIEVSTPAGSAWLRPEEAAAALAAQGTTTSSLSSSSSASLPHSAVTLVTSLMGCNPCEVLASLQRGHGVDGRPALIGHAHDGGSLSRRGDGDGPGDSGGCRAVGGAFRCLLEVAWDRDAGGVFVRRFGMEEDKKKPRYTIRAVGIRNFSIGQIPVTLEDIDAVWDQLDDAGSASRSEDASSDPGTAASTTATNSNGGMPLSPQDSGSAALSQTSRNGEDDNLAESLHETAQEGLSSEASYRSSGGSAQDSSASNVENISPPRQKAQSTSTEGEIGRTELLHSVKATIKQETSDNTGSSEPVRLPSAKPEQSASGCREEIPAQGSPSGSSGAEALVQGTTRESEQGSIQGARDNDSYVDASAEPSDGGTRGSGNRLHCDAEEARVALKQSLQMEEDDEGGDTISEIATAIEHNTAEGGFKTGASTEAREKQQGKGDNMEEQGEEESEHIGNRGEIAEEWNREKSRERDGSYDSSNITGASLECSEQQPLQPALSLEENSEGDAIRGAVRKGEDTADTKEGNATPGRHASVVEEVSNELGGPTNVASALPNVWVFPPSFSANVMLSTAIGSVQCVVEGGIALSAKQMTELGSMVTENDQSAISTGENAKDNNAATAPLTTDSAGSVASWRSIFCNYVIAGEGNIPTPNIDLEDDEAQTRLEDLITRAYGLTMDDVLQHFPPETDLGSMDSVVQSFTNSICHLRPYDHEQGGGVDTADGVRDGQVYKAVAGALRGPPEWAEMQVWVHASRVANVTVSLTPTERVATEKSTNDSAGDGVLSSAAPDPSAVATVDCSDVRSPLELKAHLLAGRVPDSAVQILERAGFFAGGAAMDISDVFATLAEEAETHGLRNRSRSKDGTLPEGAVPRVCPGRSRPITLHSRAQTENTQKVVVAVTGTPEDMRLDIKPVAVDDDVATDGAVGLCMRVSGLRSLGDPSCGALGNPLLVTGAAPATTDSRSGETLGPNNVPARDDTVSRFGGATRPDAKQAAEDPAPLDRNGELTIGSRVEARFGGRSEWFPGVVRAINDSSSSTRSSKEDGKSSDLPTVAVDYDDGDEEEHVPRVRVRLPGQKQPRILNRGDTVDFKRGKRITLATVVSSASSKEGRYDLRLMDRGETLVESVSRSAIMALHGWPPGDAKSES